MRKPSGKMDEEERMKKQSGKMDEEANE